MNESLSQAKRFVILLAAVAGLLLLTARTPAEPTPGKQDPLVAQMICEFLQRGHLSRPPIDDELSRRLFRRFLKDLDPNKLYFLLSDIDEFKKSETELDNMLRQGDLSFVYKVYERLAKRMGERQKLVEEFVAAKHDFTAKESLETDPDKIAYAASEDELRERWRKRIKFDLLLHRIEEKPVPEAEAREKVLARYRGLLKRWKQMDNFDLLEIYLTDLTTSVDPHSTYLSPSTLDEFEIALRLNLDGIGAVLRWENGQTIVSEVVPGGAAGKDGRLKSNDKIVAVAQGDGKYTDIVDMRLRDVVKLIRGTRGTKVQLKIIPVGKIETVVYELTRQKIELKSQQARGEIIEQGKKTGGAPYRIGVIDLPSFYADVAAAEGERKSATEDVRKILKDFESKKVDGVILDVRHNGGGLLTEALALTGLFIDQGPIVQVKGSQGGVKRKDDPEKGTVYAGPLMVLVSHASASASEILAGALQDYGRALIVGDSSTYGKGTVQTVVELGNQLEVRTPPKLGALKLTIQQFYRVNGDSTQARGVLSDLVLPSLTESLASVEKESEFALPFDKVNPAEHENLGMVRPELKAVLKARSARRVKESADFTKLTKEIEVLKALKARKTLPLNEKELREQFSKDAQAKIDPTADPSEEKRSSEAPYKLKRNFTNKEVLRIMEDLLQGEKLLTEK
jgi:carboxyl-terminal processing protease